jgi:RNA polymerase sigma factor (sigma-70 family)
VTGSSELDAARDVTALLTAASHLDDEHFEVLYLHYKPALTRFAARQRASDPEAVADSALFDAYRAFERLENRTEPAWRSYLFRAARSHAIADRRRSDPVPVETADDDLVEESPIDEMIEADWVRSLVDQLPPDQRAVIEHRFLRDLTAAATARELNKSPNAVYQLQHRALRRLRAAVLAAATVLLVLALWALRQQLGTFSLVDESPVDRSVVLTQQTVEDLDGRVDADRPVHETTTAPRPSRNPGTLGRSRADVETSTTNGEPAPTATTVTAPVSDKPSVTTTTDRTATTPDTPQTGRAPSTVEATSPPPAHTETCNGRPATIVGDGKIYGTDGDDVIVGSDGKDEIRGLGGNDTICGGDGKDKLYGTDGDDVLIGGPGDDKLYGDDGDDVLIGGPGKDKLNGGAGTNTLIDDDN